MAAVPKPRRSWCLDVLGQSACISKAVSLKDRDLAKDPGLIKDNTRWPQKRRQPPGSLVSKLMFGAAAIADVAWRAFVCFVCGLRDLLVASVFRIGAWIMHPIALAQSVVYC